MTGKLPKVEDTIQRNGRYHSNIRIPDQIRSQYGGKEHHRKSLGTADPKEAAKEVRAIRAIMDTQLDRAKAERSWKALAKDLPADQRKVLERAGGLDALTQEFDTGKIRLAFMHGEPSPPPEFDWQEGPNGAPEKVFLGEPDYDPEELEVERAVHKTVVSKVRAQTNDRGKLLRKLGVDVDLDGDVFSLRDLVEKLAPSVDPQTAEAYRYIVRRFTEYQGEIALADLTRAHLRDFMDEIRGLPVAHNADTGQGVPVRDLVMQDAIGWAKKHGKPTLSERTLEKHLGFLKALTAFAVEQGYRGDDPWAKFKLPKEKAKHSAARVQGRRPFTPAEVRKVLDYVCASDEPRFGDTTIDHWAPWIGAYHGLRIQEVCQLRLCDFAQIGSVWSMQITDEGEDMRAKNEATVRWVPVHPKLIEKGLREHVEKRRASHKEEYGAFEQWGRYSKRLEPLSKDSRDRVSGPYGQRFGYLRKDKLGIVGGLVGFHSFRHRFQDAADNAGIPDSHRRYLTGRANSDASEGDYGDGAGMAFLVKSLAKIDPLAGE